jgi:hypothetical protein
MRDDLWRQLQVQGQVAPSWQAYRKDLKSDRKWYAACGYDVLWFGETSGSSVS